MSQDINGNQMLDFDDESDPDLPDGPRINLYEESFGGLKDITDKWYEGNGR